MAFNGRKYEENLTEAIRNLCDSNNGNHRKIKCNAADRRASGHTLGLNPVIPPWQGHRCYQRPRYHWQSRVRSPLVVEISPEFAEDHEIEI